MAVERFIFFKPPKVSDHEEGLLGLQNVLDPELMARSPMGPVEHQLLPEGEYNLIPDYLHERAGFDMDLVVLDTGGAAVRVKARGKDSVHGMVRRNKLRVRRGGTTVNLPQDTQSFPVVSESPDGTGTVLTSLVVWKPGPNPEKLESIIHLRP